MNLFFDLTMSYRYVVVEVSEKNIEFFRKDRRMLTRDQELASGVSHRLVVQFRPHSSGECLIDQMGDLYLSAPLVVMDMLQVIMKVQKHDTNREAILQS
jgi:hypothetical protein